MPLTLTVAIIVLVVIVIVGVVGTLIDNAEEKVEHPESTPRDRHDRV
jgi:cytochrome c biogenesis protein ResB